MAAMTTMIAELYDALIAAGSPEDKARRAAEVLAGYEAQEGRLVRIEANIAELQRDVAELKRDVAEMKQRLAALERDNLLIKWMLGFVLAFQVAIFIKLFLH
jgi:septal ring factor EnvC (AmiA/AmiB activator)